MSLADQVAQLIRDFREQRPMRAGSLIITFYGDAIAPRGGTVWLGSLIRLMAAFGASHRLVRTSVFRLARDGWLSSRQIGRRSYYSLTEVGRRRFDAATRRIYSRPPQDWDGSWCLVIMPAGNTGTRETLRKELGWLGFGAFSTGVMAHPAPDMTALKGTLRELGAEHDVVTLRGQTLDGELPAALHGLVGSCWKLGELGDRYDSFLARFGPVMKSVRAARRLEPELCLQARILLIHEYRKILLRDPQLPTELLPAEWAGTAAYELCRELYCLTHAPAEKFLSRVLETEDGGVPEPAAYFYERFGGLSVTA